MAKLRRPQNRLVQPRLRGLAGLFFQQIAPTQLIHTPGNFIAGANVVPLFSWAAFSVALPANTTFTRAYAGHVKDHLGIRNLALSGESRFQGARRVRNQATGLTTQTLTVVSGNTYQVTIKGANGATCECSNAFTGTLTADGTNRISWPSGTPKTSGSTSLVLTVTGTLTELQVENVTTRTLKVPSEYVSVGVLSAPYHGANVDGVKYFSYANGNTVDVNGVVTEAQGTAIDPTTITLLMEPAATNRFFSSTDLWTAQWPATRITKGAATTAPDGSATAFKLIGVAGTNQKYLVQTLSVTLAANSIQTVYILAKKGDTDFAYAQVNDSSDILRVSTLRVNLATLAVNVAAIVAGGLLSPSGAATDFGNGWVLCKLTYTVGSAASSVTLYTGPCDSLSTTNYTGDGVKGVYIWAAQNELGAVATSLIVTATTAAATRAVDALAISGIAADNETRQVINGATVDIDDWNGTKATPTIPELISSIVAYEPGDRPA
jgi:hypothetical protein